MEAVEESKIAEMWDAIIQELELTRQAIEKASAREKKIPEFLYHATAQTNIKSILAEGLNPSKLIFSDDVVVGLSDDVGFAIRVAMETQNTKNVNEISVLKINTRHLTPSRIINYLRTADPINPDPVEASAIHEVHDELPVDPGAIEVENLNKSDKLALAGIH